jgi:hypothetical protein
MKLRNSQMKLGIFPRRSKLTALLKFDRPKPQKSRKIHCDKPQKFDSCSIDGSACCFSPLACNEIQFNCFLLTSHLAMPQNSRENEAKTGCTQGFNVLTIVEGRAVEAH